MTSSHEAATRSVLSAIEADRQDLIALCLDLGNRRDYPGQERDVGEAVAAWLQDAGLGVRTQTLSQDSVNVIGTIRGTGDRAGGGRSLILNAHMDTQGVDPPALSPLRHPRT